MSEKTLQQLIAEMPGISAETPDAEVFDWANARGDYARGAGNDSTVRKVQHASRNRLIGWMTSTGRNLSWPDYVKDTNKDASVRALVQGALDIVYRGEGGGGPGADIGDAETQAVLDSLRLAGDEVLTASERTKLEEAAAVYLSPAENAGVSVPNEATVREAREAM